jgi:hypothetical protein
MKQNGGDMKRIIALAVIISVISTVSIAIAYAQCPADKIAITKPGFYGAINTDKYNEMDAAMKKNDKDKIRSMMAEKSVSEIPSGQTVCVLDVLIIWNIKKIEVPGLAVPYWVEKDAITQVK